MARDSTAWQIRSFTSLSSSLRSSVARCQTIVMLWRPHTRCYGRVCSLLHLAGPMRASPEAACIRNHYVGLPSVLHLVTLTILDAIPQFPRRRNLCGTVTVTVTGRRVRETHSSPITHVQSALRLLGSVHSRSRTASSTDLTMNPISLSYLASKPIFLSTIPRS
jgi:hypothetical protein